MVFSIASCGMSGEQPVIETNTTVSDASDKTAASTDADFSPDFTFKTTDRAGNTYDERILKSYRFTLQKSDPLLSATTTTYW